MPPGTHTDELAWLLPTVLSAVQKHSPTSLSATDLDLDLRDLDIDGRRRFELAGELSEAVGLPGDTDDALNVLVIEGLARSRSIRQLAERAALYLPAACATPAGRRASV